jgi:alkylation response protein AidB-like acyl-CoA dehydrogenase
MDFLPTETQQLLARSLERLLAERFSLQSRLSARPSERRAGLWAALAELGLPGVEIDEAHGGSGGSFEDLMAAFGPIGAALVNEPVLASTVVATGLLVALGSSAQRDQWLAQLASGAIRACVAHGERRARDSFAWVESKATRYAQGWQLDGAKHVLLGGDDADLFLVSARTSGESGEEAGLTLFLVPRDQPGLHIRTYPLYDGSGAADLVFAELVLPADARLGAMDEAHAPLALAWDRGAVSVCVEAVGAMTALRDLTLDYLRTREQFGQPIGRFQALQHRMADAYMAVELARSMALAATVAISDPDPRARQSQVSAAKVAVGQAAREVGQTCVQLHGAIALTEDYPAGHYFKRLTMIERLFGDTDHHLDRYTRLNA